ncbi:MAG: cytochrome c oxidase accessory protein CcoG [Reyranellaceae bacterium]
MPDDGLKPDEAVSTRTQKESQPLYASRIKVYPRRVKGLYRNIKWALLVFCLAVYYLVPFIRFDRGPGAPDQAVLIDLQGQRGYFFWIEIWPQEVYYITGLLILAAFALFLATALLGRVWCGYACPQTVWTDLFMAVERLIEGDRNARIRLDKQPMSGAKALRKGLKHFVWLLIAAGTGGAWVLYFGNAPDVLRQVFTGEAGVATYFFIGLFTFTTYALAGWAREQVCTYMCPWPRFQAAMLDEHSLVVTYRAWRGEKRGKHKKGDTWEGRGDCVDCTACVAVCPTGIDIRDGQQLECIGCGLCIDACNDVMGKVGRPHGLIAFDTFANTAAAAKGGRVRVRLVRPRTVIYGALMVLVGAIMLGTLLTRTTLDFHVLPDRAPLFVTLSGGVIQNGYTIKLQNRARMPASLAFSVGNLPGAQIEIIGHSRGDLVLEVGPDTVASFRVLVRAPRTALKSESTPIVMKVTDQDREAAADTAFRGPAR